MITNRSEYNDMCNTRENVRRALKRIAIAIGEVKTAENEGYVGVSTGDCNNFLEELTSILEGRS